MKVNVESVSERETIKIAKALGQEISKSKYFSGAVVLSLTGELGSGKTMFVKGVARGLGLKKRILSPTFILLRSHKLGLKNYKTFHHIDCYRVKARKLGKRIDWKMLVKNEENIIAVEWAEKIGAMLPKKRIDILLKHKGGNMRTINIRFL